MSPDRAHPTPTPLFRSTTGQAVSIRYDQRTNTIEFAESDWAADGVHGGTMPRETLRQRVAPTTITRLRRRA